jgi:hypothetical protein
VEIIEHLIRQCIVSDSLNIPLSLGVIDNLRRDLDATKSSLQGEGLKEPYFGSQAVNSQAKKLEIAGSVLGVPAGTHPIQSDKQEKVSESAEIAYEEKATIMAYLHDPPALHVRRY